MKRRTRWILVGGGVGATLLVVAVIASFVLGLGTPISVPRASLVATAVPGGIEITHQQGDVLRLDLLEFVVSTGSEEVSLTAEDTSPFAPGNKVTINLRASPPTITVNDHGYTTPSIVRGALNVNPGDIVAVKMFYWTPVPGGLRQKRPIASFQVTPLPVVPGSSPEATVLGLYDTWKTSSYGSYLLGPLDYILCADGTHAGDRIPEAVRQAWLSHTLADAPQQYTILLIPQPKPQDPIFPKPATGASPFSDMVQVAVKEVYPNGASNTPGYMTGLLNGRWWLVTTCPGERLGPRA